MHTQRFMHLLRISEWTKPSTWPNSPDAKLIVDPSNAHSIHPPQVLYSAAGEVEAAVCAWIRELTAVDLSSVRNLLSLKTNDTISCFMCSKISSWIHIIFMNHASRRGSKGTDYLVSAFSFVLAVDFLFFFHLSSQRKQPECSLRTAHTFQLRRLCGADWLQSSTELPTKSPPHHRRQRTSFDVSFIYLIKLGQAMWKAVPNEIPKLHK